jgi:cobalt-zinc-cadmium efflux system membrane fusion protein
MEENEMKRVLSIALALVIATVVIGLGVVAAKPGWLPSWTRPASVAGGKEAGLFCKEHGVPEKFCTICHEELKTALVLCKEHGDIPEDICTLCHPEVAEKYGLEMCPKGHGLPREFCLKCGKSPSADASAAIDDGWCATHNQPESQCADCLLEPKPEGAEKVCRQPLPDVRLASAKLARQVGIQTAEAIEETHEHTLSANAETAYNANAYADVSPRVAGFIREVKADLGRKVQHGDVLAVVDSSEVSAAKAQFLTTRSTAELSQVTYDRTMSLTRSGAIAAKSELESLTALNQAKAGALDAEQRLRNFGFDDAALQHIAQERDTRSYLDVIAPIDGEIVVRHAVRGESVQATTPLFSVADTSLMWLWIDVFESDVSSIRPGQKVKFTIGGNDLARSVGTINWIGAEVNPRTRTTRVRAELSNAEGRLRSNQFGQAEIQIGDPHKAIVVPKKAVQTKDGVHVVFIPLKTPGVYRPQRVVSQPTDDNDTLEITWGLKAGQTVVTTGAFLLKTEIMKGAIGAGCCE